jgi:diketogulonate reductase-like aldo/keto reductase
MEQLKNKNGLFIPQIGLGTYPFEGLMLANMIRYAVIAGYRLFDTADDYRGEPGIGLAINSLTKYCDLKREDLFLQTKISDNNAHEDEPLKGIFFNRCSKFMQRHSVEEIVREKVSDSLRNMQTTYIDSLLIHYPFPDYYVEIWKVMIQLKAEGVVRYIGVSNFHERHIQNLIEQTGVVPEINEVYQSPIGTKESLNNYCNSIGCLMMTYSPLMDLSRNKLPLSAIEEIASKYEKSAAQVILRWNIERGCLPLPKSKNSQRIEENFNIFDFSLTSEEVRLISSLNYDSQLLVESKICPGL